MSSSKLSRVILSLILAASALLAVNNSASAQTAPDLTVNYASCYQNIVSDGDLFCLTRYNLPDSILDGVPDAWCAELFITTGCAGSPAQPNWPTSLPQDLAFITLFDNCATGPDCSAGDILNVTRIPRIGFSVGGSYMTPGHAVTFGDTDISLCVQSSDLLFVSPSQSCTAVTWALGASDQASQRVALGTDMVTQIFTVGIEQSRPTNWYITNNLINSSGKILALEALPNSDRFLDVFSSGSALIVVPGMTPVAGSTVQASINTTSSAVQTAKTNFGTAAGLGGDAVGILVSLAFVFAVTVAALVFTKNMLFALVAGVSFASVMVVFGVLPFQALALLIAALALPAAVKIIRTVTQ